MIYKFLEVQETDIPNHFIIIEDFGIVETENINCLFSKLFLDIGKNLSFKGERNTKVIKKYAIIDVAPHILLNDEQKIYIKTLSVFTNNEKNQFGFFLSSDKKFENDSIKDFKLSNISTNSI